MRPDFAEEWNSAIEQLVLAAEDTAAFKSGLPIGRSRTASIRRLAAAVDELRELERRGDRTALAADPRLQLAAR